MKMGKWRVLPSRDFILDLGGWGLLFHVILPKIVELIRVAHAWNRDSPYTRDLIRHLHISPNAPNLIFTPQNFA